MNIVRRAIGQRVDRDRRELLAPWNVVRWKGNGTAAVCWDDVSSVTAHTDGSLDEHVLLGPSMGFGARIEVFAHGREQPRDTRDVKGCCREGPFSSTVAEVLAIVMAMALVPPTVRLTIRSDSRAAIGAMEALQQRDPKMPWRKSTTKRQEGRTAADEWIWNHTSERTSYVGINTADWASAGETLARVLPASAQGRMLEARTRRLVQRAYRQRLGYVRERWVYRNECQIGRKKDSRISPSRRRWLMRLEQPVLEGVDDGVPEWPRTMPPGGVFRLFAQARHALLGRAGRPHRESA
ncbi:hypothetical protein H4R26_001417 [Coemansia thaxteri]|uniref:RNase H type-1 domain-containing protein n=1 Tax=Coemansia thaxteri TaxID=2663907 RepID=A0A9W8BN00_9FUNG|nr:hypothetical protein H4R26_001417 [Coemansia thaxteri]